MTVRAVLVDYGDTLVGFDRPEGGLLRAYHQINARLEAELEREVPPAADLLREVSLGVDREIERSYAAGSELEVDIAALYDASLRRIGLELPPALVSWVMDQEQDAWLQGLALGPHVGSVLEALRGAGLRLCIVSNAAYPPAAMRQQLRHLGIFHAFDATVYSSEIGVRKPNRAIYEEALRLVGAGPEEAVFVGDRLREDVRGPRALGIRAFLTHEFRQETPAPAEEVTILGSLAGLPGAIRALA